MREESEEKERRLEREGELLALGRLGGEGARERVREREGVGGATTPLRDGVVGPPMWAPLARVIRYFQCKL